MRPLLASDIESMRDFGDGMQWLGYGIAAVGLVVLLLSLGVNLLKKRRRNRAGGDQ